MTTLLSTEGDPVSYVQLSEEGFQVVYPLGLCYTDKAPNNWHRQGKNRERLQSTQMTTKRHNSHTRHQAPAKGHAQPKSRITPTSTAAMHASITSTSC